MHTPHTVARREFLQRLGLSAAAAPFVLNLPSLGFSRASAAEAAEPPRRLVVIFSPNGVIPKTFWPDALGVDKYKETADFELTGSLAPLAPFQDRTLLLRGVDNKMRGDGDRHMRGIGCLLTGRILYPGNVQGGSDTPAGWSSGISVDQAIKNHLQANPATETRFGSLEFGVMVPDRADTWTRMVYAGPNRPLAPEDDPHRMFKKLYGRAKDEAVLATVLDDVRADLNRVKGLVAAEDRAILEQHETFVREMERQLARSEPVGKPDGGADDAEHLGHALPEPDPALELLNDRIPEIAAAQRELLVDAFQRDACRVATLQYTNSVGGAKMRWLGDRREPPHALPRAGRQQGRGRQADPHQRLVRRGGRRPLPQAGRHPRAGAFRFDARSHHGRLDERDGHREQPQPGGRPVGAGRRRAGVQGRPGAAHGQRAAQPFVAEPRPAVRHRGGDVRPGGPVRGRRAERPDGVTIPGRRGRAGVLPRRRRLGKLAG